MKCPLLVLDYDVLLTPELPEAEESNSDPKGDPSVFA